MKVCPVEDLLESGKYVLKRNPWYTMWEDGKVAYMKKAPQECIIAKVPPWAKARGGLDAAPAGVKAVDAISSYIWSLLDNIHPGYRTAITEKVWSKVTQAVEGGAQVSEEDIRRWVDEAINELAKELGTTPEAIRESGKKKKEILERRRKTRSGLIALGKRLVAAGVATRKLKAIV